MENGDRSDMGGGGGKGDVFTCCNGFNVFSKTLFAEILTPNETTRALAGGG